MDPAHGFEWDDAKAESNLAKHGVPFDYAARVFLDAQRVDFDVTRPADGEDCRKAIGVIEGRLYAVVYTARGERLRLISARRCNVTEERRYGPLHARPE